MKKCLVFGASGVIGSEVVTRFESHGYEVWRASRSAKGGSAQNLVAVGDSEIDSHAMKSWPEFDAVVWAQGSNVNDSIVNFSSQVFDEVPVTVHVETVFVSQSWKCVQFWRVDAICLILKRMSNCMILYKASN